MRLLAEDILRLIMGALKLQEGCQMEFRCKLSGGDDLVWRLRKAVKEPLRSYEVHPTEESLGWGRSMVCEYDYTVHVPALKLFFRDAV